MKAAVDDGAVGKASLHAKEKRKIWFCGGWDNPEERENAIGAFIRAQCQRASRKEDYAKLCRTPEQLLSRLRKKKRDKARY